MSDESNEFDKAFDAISTGEYPTVDNASDNTDEPTQETEEEVPTAEESSETGNEETEDTGSESKSDRDAEVEKLQQTIMRQAASQSALQKKLNEAKVVKQKQFAPVLDEDGVFTESFAELKKEFPEADFGRVEDIIKQQQEQIIGLQQQFTQQVEQTAEAQRAQHLKEQTRIVQQTHPDLEEAVRSEEFTKWQGTLTPAELNHVRSAVNADEINNIMNVFKSVTGYKSKAIKEAESAEIAETTAAKREKLNKAAQGVQTKQQSSPATTAVDAIDEDALFDQVFKDLGMS